MNQNSIFDNLITKFFGLSEKNRFIIVGIYNTAFSIVLFALLYFLLSPYLFYLAIYTITHFISVANSFYFMKNYVFKSKNENVLYEFMKCNVMYLIVLSLNSCLLLLFVEFLELHPILALILAIGVVTIVNYYGQKLFAFK